MMITVSTVVNASRTKLLCISYEILLEKINSAKTSNKKDKDKYIKEAIKVIHMLVNDLDFNFEVSRNLFDIYVYIQGLLINNKGNKELEEAYLLIQKLYSSYHEVELLEGKTKSVMENTENIYAGFTYDNNKLKEIYLKEPSRGFKA